MDKEHEFWNTSSLKILLDLWLSKALIQPPNRTVTNVAGGTESMEVIGTGHYSLKMPTFLHMTYFITT